MASPFSVAPSAPVDPERAAALQGIRQRSGGAAPPAQAQAPAGPPPGSTVPTMFADLAQAIIQDVNARGFSPEIIQAFQQFIQFFQQIVEQAGGGQAAPPGQGAPAPAGPPPQGGLPPGPGLPPGQGVI